MDTNSLNQIPANEWYQTLVTLQKAGITAGDLKKIRSDPEYASKIAKLFSVRKRRTMQHYPSEFRPLGIVEQVKALQKVPAFAELDAAWALNEAQSWYDELDHPEWVEQPLVYVWHKSVGGYHNAIDLVLSAIAKEREFRNYRKGQLTPEYLYQTKETCEAEAMLKAGQPGDFLIVPSQVGDRWGGYTIKEVRESYDEGEFGHGAVAAGCLALTHPKRLMLLEALHMDCPGDESADPDLSSRFEDAPFFCFDNGGVEFNISYVGNSHEYFGSVSGFVPQ